jgi:anhydro-N-acetylmuramic acid kinase
MVIDAVTERLFGQPYDRDGRIAASGAVIDPVVSDLLRLPFFRRKPPKTSGREEFGREFAQQFVKRCGRASKADVVASATALTARSIADALRRFVLSRRGNFREFVVSGGGANNPTLLAMLANELRPLDLTIRASDEFGLPSPAKEAAAFALMAYETWSRRPSNIPSATGAKRPAILGKISYA